MSRLYWSNLPDANRPRGGTSALCSSFTTEDLPMPEYPDTSITIGAILWLDDDESRAGLLLIKPRCFVEEECGDEVIERCVPVIHPTAAHGPGAPRQSSWSF